MSITVYFADLPDPRGLSNAKRYSFHEIIVIALCAMLRGATSFVEMSDFGEAKIDWLRERLGLGLTYGIPSHDTFNDVFTNLDPEAFGDCLLRWTQSIHQATQGQVVAIDGKTLRRSFDSASGKAALHMVSAWSNHNGLVLAQMAVDQKSNEITAVPALLHLLDIRGCLVTVDALNTQKAIAQQIHEQGGDYLMALKDNHRTLHEDASAYFEWGLAREAKGADPVSLFASYASQSNFGHGRHEERRCCCVEATEVFPVEVCPDTVAQWPGLRSVIMVERRRSESQTFPDGRQEWQPATVDRRYYLSSLAPDAGRIGEAVREHWGIENRLHWSLDVSFSEDQCRIRIGNAAINMATLRHIALNLLRLETSKKRGIKTKISRAAWDQEYLLKVLAGPQS
jgi:predicted transposase YbfD/YdcC